MLMRVQYLFYFFIIHTHAIFALESWQTSDNHLALKNSTDAGYFSLNNKAYFSLNNSGNTNLHTLSANLLNISRLSMSEQVGKYFYIDATLHFIEKQSGDISTIDQSGNATIVAQSNTFTNNFNWIPSNDSSALFVNNNTLLILNSNYLSTELGLSESTQIKASKFKDTIFSIHSQSNSSLLKSTYSSDALATQTIQSTLNEELSDLNKIFGISINEYGERFFFSTHLQQINFWMAEKVDSTFSKTLIADQNIDSPLFYINYHEAHLIVYQANTLIKLSYSLDRGKSWTTKDSLSFSGNIIGASLNTKGKLDIWSSQGERLLLEDPFFITPFEAISATTHLSEVNLDWPMHPLVKEYDIFYNNTKIATIQAPPYMYPAGLLSDDTFKVIALPNNDFKSEQSWSYSPTHTNEMNIFLPAVQSQSDIQLLSFPASSSVKFDDSNESVLAHLERFLGSDHNPSIWKIGTWLPASASYIEGKNINKIGNNNGYWLMSSFNMSFTVTYPVQNTEFHYLRLNPGWNTIGSFFEGATSLTYGNIYENSQKWDYNQINNHANPPIQPQVWHWNSGSYTTGTTINHGKGYWIKNERDQNLILKLVKNNNSNLTKPYYAPNFKTESPPDPMNFTQATSSHSSGGGGCFIRSSCY